MNLYKRIVIFLAMLPFAACGEGAVMLRYDQARLTAAVLADGCREELSNETERRMDAVVSRSATGDKDGAKVDLEQWKVTHSKVKIGCSSLKTLAETAKVLRPTIKASMSRDADVAGWIARLAALGADAVRIATEAGLKLPGAK